MFSRPFQMPFQDLFSRQAATYAAARPEYPAALFEFIVSCAPRRDIVWDCATGNGQAARGLAAYFTTVVATDASPEQIAHATGPANVEFRVAPASASGLASHSVDAVTVAQALHWFPDVAFFTEVRRVTQPDGIVAAWSYGYCHAGEDVEAILRQFEDVDMGPYWYPGRRWVDEEYRTIPFPFAELPAPVFELRATWTLRQLGAYLRSWSAVANFQRQTGEDPIPAVLDKLAAHWGSPDQVRTVVWPLNIRVGRMG